MKSTNCLLFLILFTLIPAFLFSQADRYSFKRKLNSVENPGFYSISVLPEIIAQCKSNLNDIRIYNFTGKDTAEIPYVLEWQGATYREKAISFDRINDTYNEKCCSYLTLKINKKQIINRIKLDIADANFDKWVMIEGSSDNKNWFTIKEHLRIVRFQNRNEHFEYTTLDFQNTEYTYYRLKFDDDGSKPIAVITAYAYEIDETPGNYHELKILNSKQTENKNEKSSELIVEFPFNYRIDHITIKSNTKKDFYRNINLYRSGGIVHTAGGDKEYWYIINKAIFSSIGKNAISCNNERIQKLKIQISNYNDEPVEINEVKAFAEKCHLVADLPVSGNIHLTYGKANDNSPTYDLIHFKEKIPDALLTINYGAEEVLPLPSVAKGALVENKNWLWLSMSAIVLLIGFFSFRMLKKENE